MCGMSMKSVTTDKCADTRLWLIRLPIEAHYVHKQRPLFRPMPDYTASYVYPIVHLDVHDNISHCVKGVIRQKLCSASNENDY